jgi:predicted RND superfamily exporter protein
LLTATFPPLAEMGLVTSVGVALTLVGGLWIIPAAILIGGERGGK